MNKFFKNKAFILGFLAGISVITALNLYTVYKMFGCHHCDLFFGFPLPFYSGIIAECGSGNFGFICNIWEFSWIGALVDFVVAIIFSFIVGFIFKLVWGKLATKTLK